MPKAYRKIKLMNKSLILNEETTQGHVIFIYQSAKERLEILAQYFKQGLKNNELCVLVTSGTIKSAIKNFLSVNFDINSPLGSGSLKIYEMKATYLPNGEFVTDYMLSNINTFIQNAQDDGYHGLRTAGEMSWIEDCSEYVDDVVDYEHRVNEINTPDINFIGLCLFPMIDSFSQLLDALSRSHPSIIYDGCITTNGGFNLTKK